MAERADGRPAAEMLLEQLAEPPARADGLAVGTLTGFAGDGSPLADYANAPGGRPAAARTTAPLGPADVGRQVVLAFEGGDWGLPIVLGKLHAPAAPAVEADGERLTFEAGREIVFKCGESSITLTRAGKVLIRGAYLLSRSSGVNRIKGGSVEIN